MNLRQTHLVLQCLYDVEAYAVNERKMGICDALDDLLSYRECSREDRKEAEDWIKAVATGWPLFSGDLYYPVAVTERPSHDWHTLNLWEGAYGEKRRAFLDYLIQNAQTRLSKLMVCPLMGASSWTTQVGWDAFDLVLDGKWGCRLTRNRSLANIWQYDKHTFVVDDFGNLVEVVNTYPIRHIFLGLPYRSAWANQRFFSGLPTIRKPFTGV